MRAATSAHTDSEYHMPWPQVCSMTALACPQTYSPTAATVKAVVAIAGARVGGIAAGRNVPIRRSSSVSASTRTPIPPHRDKGHGRVGGSLERRGLLTSGRAWVDGKPVRATLHRCDGIRRQAEDCLPGESGRCANGNQRTGSDHNEDCGHELRAGAQQGAHDRY